MLGQGLWPRSHFVEVVNFAFLTKPSFVIWDVVLFVNMAPFGYRQVSFGLKVHPRKNCRLILVVLSRRNRFGLLFQSFEFYSLILNELFDTMWIFFFGFCYIILYWKLETDYPWETEADVITWNIQVFQLVLIFILFCSSRRRDFPVKWCFWQFKRQITG